MWKAAQKMLGYSDQELETFKQNPRNQDVLSQVPALSQKTIVATVVRSHGCASGHGQGDKILFDSAGNLLTKHAPSKICIHMLHGIQPLIYAAVELMMAGVDPNQMRFNRASCIDVGLECGGWGRIVVELSVKDRADSGA